MRRRQRGALLLSVRKGFCHRLAAEGRCVPGAGLAACGGAAAVLSEGAGRWRSLQSARTEVPWGRAQRYESLLSGCWLSPCPCSRAGRSGIPLPGAVTGIAVFSCGGREVSSPGTMRFCCLSLTLSSTTVRKSQSNVRKMRKKQRFLPSCGCWV